MTAPELSPNRAAAPKWVRGLLDKQGQIEDALGMPLGPLLGCGYFGCVFEGAPPWAIKLTRDPTEGDVWQFLLQWQATDAYGIDGVARVRDVVRLRPDVKYRRGTWPVHAIVREQIAPLWAADTMAFSAHTNERLGFPDGASWYTLHDRRWLAMLEPRARGNAKELLDLLRGLQVFYTAAQEYHKVAQRRPDSALADSARERMLRATNLMGGPIGGYIGESLTVLVEEGLVLKDVHLANIGWRVYSEVGGEAELPLSLIIFDPGHTPTGEQDVRETLLRNAIPLRELEARDFDRGIVDFIAEDDENHYAARLRNGWVRIGVFGSESWTYDVPPEHPLYEKVRGATPETVEDIYDEIAPL